MSQTHVDRRTPTATFDSFKRAVLRSQKDALWSTLHPCLQRRLEQQAAREGDQPFLRRLEKLVANEHGPLLLGEPARADDLVYCPLMRAGHRVGTATFRFEQLGWWLFSLS